MAKQGMVTQSVGIRSLAVSFPRTIRTNDYWRQKFPELGAVRVQRQVKLPLSASTSNQNGIDIWLQQVSPYLSDPFRGSVERRVLGEDESAIALECRAAQDALDAAKLGLEEIDLAIAAAIFPDTVGPSHGVELARRLGLRCPAWNLESTCSSALIALQNAQALVQTGVYRHILVVVSQLGSQSVNEADTLSQSMGDGAGAFVVSAMASEQGILSTAIMSTAATYRAYIHELGIDSQGKPYLQTRTGENASSLAETAVDFVRNCCQKAVKAAGIDLDQIDFFSFNTPTAWYAQVCAQALGIAPEKTIDLYPWYANIGAVFPVANLYHAALTKKIRPNDLVLVYSNGAAATAAAIVMRWGDVGLGKVPDPPLNLPAAETIYLSPPIDKSVDVNFRERLLGEAPAVRQETIAAYLLNWLAEARQLSPSQLNSQLLLTSCLDSLMVAILRIQIEKDFQIGVPMEKFFNSTVEQLTNFLLERLALANLMAAAIVTDGNLEEREIVSL